VSAVSSRLEARLRTIPDVVGVVARTVVALPPSDADPIWDEMRVVVSGILISRAFDPGAVIITGAPLTFLTEGGDDLLTEGGDSITTETAT
jgi:hypothetical protein